MESENSYNSFEKVESSDEVLLGNAVDSLVYYDTLHKRSIAQHEVLNKIFSSIFTVDFLIAYYLGNRDTLAYIEKLRADVNEKSDNAAEAKRILKTLDPPTDAKVAIIIENLLKVSEKQKGGIANMQGCIYVYTGCYWQALTEDFIRHFLSAVAEKSGIPHFQASKTKFVDILYKQLLESSALPEIKSSSKEVKINLKNGTFKCSNGTFGIYPFSPDDRLLYQLSFDYDPNAKADKFMRFLDDVIPEKEAKMVVAEYIGYIFAKHLRWEKCLVLLGSGANGKSVLLDIITALLGEKNVCHYSLSRLCEANGYYRAELDKFLLNACSEIGIKNSDHEMVKQLFSCDPVGARSPYGKPITVSGYCRLLFSANCISNKDLEHTHGYFRKYMYLLFNATIPEWKKNPNLAREIIEEELSGVFNWALEGLERILQEGRRGFTYSAHIDREGKNIERNSNSVALFVDEYNYQSSSKGHTDAKTLYDKYKGYCDENRYGAVSKQEFLRRLEEQLHFQVKRKATNGATWVYCEVVAQSEEKSDQKGLEICNLVEEFRQKGIINDDKKEYL